MTYSVLRYALFVACFAASFYACSCIRFEVICKTREPVKVYVLLFLLSLVLAYLATEAILSLTVFNGFGL